LLPELLGQLFKAETILVVGKVVKDSEEQRLFKAFGGEEPSAAPPQL
jgi:hypothetical protein